MEEPVVILDGLTYTYAGSETPAIKDIDLTVRPGSLLLLLGPAAAANRHFLLPDRFYSTQL